ncbi:TIGR03905 family TSCPD domain-containing protein [Caldicellulosiruptoraceae bacterium PP1]
MIYEYKTKGICASRIIFELDNNKLHNVQFIDGCTGNLQGLSNLLEGMEVSEVIKRLKGIKCQGNTSCPDQLTKALEEVINEININGK